MMDSILWGELAEKLKSGEIEYLEVYDNVVYLMMNDGKPEYQNLRGAVERDGDKWVVRWGFATIQRIPRPADLIDDIYELMALIYFMARADMEYIVPLPLSQKREWVTITT